ncbi:MAG: HNH endonuclease [Treponema sp.]|nr:HNH endonuclease [Treponema sp.]
MKYNFKEHNILRNCDKKFDDYHKYKPYLKNDFSCRCAYCNLRDESVTTHFEIDHYIPKDAFENTRPELLTLYDNLVYSCKKCNQAKSSKFEGEVNSNPLDNELFYNPAVVDYNTIFYRDESGSILSDDKKGRNMIKLLKLYRPINNLAWICEKLYDCRLQIEEKMTDLDTGSNEYKSLNEIKHKLVELYSDLRDYFIANYNEICLIVE